MLNAGVAPETSSSHELFKASILRAQSFSRLAIDHIHDIRLPEAKRAVACHIRACCKELREAGVLHEVKGLRSLEKLEIDSAEIGDSDLMHDIFCLRDATSRFRNRCGSQAFDNRIARYCRDMGAGFVAALILAIAFYWYHNDTLNIWAKVSINFADFSVQSVHQGWGELKKNRTVTNVPIIVQHNYYAEGLGTHADSVIVLHLKKTGKRFRGACAYPDTVRSGKIICSIEIDGHVNFESAVLDSDNPLQDFDVETEGRQEVALKVRSASHDIGAAHAVWIKLNVY